MEIKKDDLQVVPATSDPGGARLEPEERPAARILDTSSEVGTNVGGTMPAAQVPTKVVFEGTVGEFAPMYRDQCKFCKHFDLRAGRELMRRLDRSQELADRLFVNQLRILFSTSTDDVTLRHTGEDGMFDADHAVYSMGICRALTEIAREPVFTYPLRSCPTEMRDDRGQVTPLEKPLFEPRDARAEQVGENLYDTIMRAAMVGDVSFASHRASREATQRSVPDSTPDLAPQRSPWVEESKVEESKVESVEGSK